MFRSVMLVQLSPCRNDSPSPLPRLYRECRHRSRGTTVNDVPIPAITAVSVIKFNPITAVVPSSPSPCSSLAISYADLRLRSLAMKQNAEFTEGG